MLKAIISETVEKFLNQKKYINEGASDILYHFTDAAALVNMLEENSIHLSSAMGSVSDYNINKKKMFYLSTTRSRSSGYKRGTAKLVLDGRKLKYNYQISPVDYWNWSKSRKDWDNTSSYIDALKSLEQEDRIISDKATIDNLSNYILSIHVLIYKNDTNRKIKQLIELCEQKNISLFLYDNQKNWLNQIKPIDASSIDFSNVEDDNKRYSFNFDYETAAMLAYRDNDNFETIKAFLKDNDKIEKFEKVIKDLTQKYFKLGGLYAYDGIIALSSNVKFLNNNHDQGSIFLKKMLAKDFKKYGVSNVKDYIEKKQYIGKKTTDDLKKEYYQYLVSIGTNEIHEGIERYLSKYIEIDGEYIDHAYDSPQLINVLNHYIKQINLYLKSQIMSEENDIFKYSFTLDKDYIKKHISFNDIKLSEKINITDYYDDVETLDEDFKKLIDYYILSPINNVFYDKAKSLFNEYQNQFQ